MKPVSATQGNSWHRLAAFVELTARCIEADRAYGAGGMKTPGSFGKRPRQDISPSLSQGAQQLELLHRVLTVVATHAVDSLFDIIKLVVEGGGTVPATVVTHGFRETVEKARSFLLAAIDDVLVVGVNYGDAVAGVVKVTTQQLAAVFVECCGESELRLLLECFRLEMGVDNAIKLQALKAARSGTYAAPSTITESWRAASDTSRHISVIIEEQLLVEGVDRWLDTLEFETLMRMATCCGMQRSVVVAAAEAAKKLDTEQQKTAAPTERGGMYDTSLPRNTGSSVSLFETPVHADPQKEQSPTYNSLGGTGRLLLHEFLLTVMFPVHPDDVDVLALVDDREVVVADDTSEGTSEPGETTRPDAPPTGDGTEEQRRPATRGNKRTAKLRNTATVKSSKEIVFEDDTGKKYTVAAVKKMMVDTPRVLPRVVIEAHRKPLGGGMTKFELENHYWVDELRTFARQKSVKSGAGKKAAASLRKPQLIAALLKHFEESKE